MHIYTGIGSRTTPDTILPKMTSIATMLAKNWILRSGHAEGADWAFELGALNYANRSKTKPRMEIFIPWGGYNSQLERDENPYPESPSIAQNFIVPAPNAELIRVAALFHPAWDKCSPAAKFLHMRNVCQIAGENLDTPTDMVICWTHRGKRAGGTGQALRIAEYLSIPIFDLALPDTQQQLIDFVAKKEKEQYASTRSQTENHNDNRAGSGCAEKVEAVAAEHVSR